MALTDAQFKYLMDNYRSFQRSVEQYGRPKYVKSCNDPDANPGDICLEEACVDGKQRFHFCNRVNQCLIVRTVPC
jgi:hypothetical protein